MLWNPIILRVDYTMVNSIPSRFEIIHEIPEHSLFLQLGNVFHSHEFRPYGLNEPREFIQ